MHAKNLRTHDRTRTRPTSGERGNGNRTRQAAWKAALLDLARSHSDGVGDLVANQRVCCPGAHVEVDRFPAYLRKAARRAAVADRRKGRLYPVGDSADAFPAEAASQPGVERDGTVTAAAIAEAVAALAPARRRALSWRAGAMPGRVRKAKHDAAKAVRAQLRSNGLQLDLSPEEWEATRAALASLL